MIAIQRRVREIAIIKAVLAAAVLVIMIATFPRPLPLVVAVLDLALVAAYAWLGPRYPVTATYLLVAETALALTPRQFVQGYVNGVNWLLYIPLPLAARYVTPGQRTLIYATILVTAIAAPVMLLAALTLPPQMEKSDVIALLGYVLVILWGIVWLNSRAGNSEESPGK